MSESLENQERRGVQIGTVRGPYRSKQAGAVMTFAEIGKVLGVTGGAASLIFHSAMRKLSKSHSGPNAPNPHEEEV